MRPVDFATDGVFLCGMAHYPKHIDETIAQACAVGSRAGILLARGVVEAEANISVVDETTVQRMWSLRGSLSLQCH